MERIIQEKTVSDLRADLNKFGYSEKGRELNSNGELESNFIDILSYLLKEWKEKNGDSCELTFTSGNDTFHKNRKSRHSNGEAVDLTLSQECRSSFIKLLERYKSIYNGFSYIDEYTHPSKGATGGHFHLSYRKGQPEGIGNNGKTSTTDTPETTDDTTVSSGDRHNVYGGLLDIIPGLDTAKKNMERLLNQTESIDNKLDRLNEDIDKIKKLIKY